MNDGKNRRRASRTAIEAAKRDAAQAAFEAWARSDKAEQEVKALAELPSSQDFQLPRGYRMTDWRR
jgi:hypothetical protein